ncbi:hypothetical protein P8452_52607 [Trifolium repens]|nr:hypothetical protein P8452_52607 [Trifolium repens]
MVENMHKKYKQPIIPKEKLIKADGDLTATRAGLQCLLPNKVISDLVLTLAEKTRWVQSDANTQFVWSLPPSFEADFCAGVKLKEMKEKYSSHWMPPFSNLKFIYVPIKTTGGHWFLMIVHLEQGIIYHLDTYCLVECAELRKM